MSVIVVNNSWFQVAAPALGSDQACTIMCWMAASAVGATSTQQTFAGDADVITIWSGTIASNCIHIQLGADGNLYFEAQTNSYAQSEVYTYSGGVTLNAWHHVALARDASGIRAYINGGLSGTAGHNVTFPTWGTFQIGTLRGSVQDARFYTTALSTAQIQACYRERNANPGVVTVASYPFFPGSGIRVVDFSGQGRTLTPSGSAAASLADGVLTAPAAWQAQPLVSVMRSPVNASGSTPLPIDATSTTVSSATATLNVIAQLAATAPTVSSAVAALNVRVPVSASAPTVSSATATLNVRVNLAATSSTVSSATAALQPYKNTPVAQRYTGQHSELSSVSFTATGPLTLMGWMRPTASAGIGGDLAYMDSGGGISQNTQSWIGFTSANLIAFSLQDLPQAYNYNPAYTNDVWVHLALTYDGTNARSYINGVLVDGPTAVNLSGRAAHNYADIGYGGDFSAQCPQFYQGVALTQAQIYESMVRLAPPTGATPYAWFPFDYADPATDASGNGHTLVAIADPSPQFLIAGPYPSSATVSSTAALLSVNPTFAAVDTTVSSTSAALSVGVALAATSTTTSTTTAALSVALPIAATSPTVSSATAALRLTLPIAASDPTVSSATATLNVIAQLAATAPTVSSAVVSLYLGLPLAAAAPTTSSTVATLRVTVNLAATAATTSSAVATLSVIAQLAATAATVSSSAVSLYVDVPLAATSTTTSTTSAALAITGTYAATSTTVSSASATLYVGIPLAATPTTTSTTVAALQTAIPLAALAATISSAVAALNVRVPLAATPGTVSSAVAALVVPAPLAATSTTVSSATAALQTSLPLSATAPTVSSAVAALVVAAGLAATSSTVSSAVAGLRTHIPLAATSSTVSSTAAAISVNPPLAATSTTVSSATAALSVGVNLAAVDTTTSSATAALRLTLPIAATSSTVSSATAGLSVALPISATSGTTSSAVATLVSGVSLAATSSTVSSASALLSVNPTFAVVDPTISSANAALRVTVNLAAVAPTVSSTSASLIQGQVYLAANAATVSGSHNDLYVGVPLLALSDTWSDDIVSLTLVPEIEAVAYLTLAEFMTRTLMPLSHVEWIEAKQPGFTDIQLALESSRMDARLRKRYACPFEEPFSIILQTWLTQIVTFNIWIRRGFSPTDEEGSIYLQQFNTAWAEIKEASDSIDGLFDLPLRADTTKTGIVKRNTMSYTETSPTVWRREQRRIGREEERNGKGTTRRG